MSIAGIDAIGGLGLSAGVFGNYADYAARATAAPTATGYVGDAAPAGNSATGFANALADAVNTLGNAQARVSQLGVDAVSGRLDNVHDYTIASSEAQVALELTAAIRNSAVQAFNEIMRMQA